MGEIVGEGKLEQKCAKPEDYTKRKKEGWSKSVQNRKIAPRGKNMKASWLEQKCTKPEDYSKREE